MAERTMPTRRTALAVFAATASAGLPATAAYDELERSVAAHKEASGRWSRLLDRLEDISDRYDAQRVQIVIELSLGQSIKTFADPREVCEIRDIASEIYERARQSVAVMRRIAPDVADDYLAALDAAERDDLASIGSIFADEKIRREQFGLGAIEREEQAAMQAEDAAMMALLSYEARTIEEARRKAKYILTTRCKDELSEEALSFFASFLNAA